MSEENASGGPLILPAAPPIGTQESYRQVVPGTNGHAIAALCLGIFGFLPLAAILALYFGLSALSQFKTRIQHGKGLAVGGLCAVGAWWVVIGAVVVGIAVTGGEDALDDGTAAGPTRPADTSLTQYTDLQPGVCVTGVAEHAPATRVKVVGCADPHMSEVVGRFELPTGPYPGEAAVAEQASAECNTQLTEYAPNLAEDDTKLLYLPPSRGTWRNNRVVVCLAYRATPYTGSIRDDVTVAPTAPSTVHPIRDGGRSQREAGADRLPV